LLNVKLVDASRNQKVNSNTRHFLFPTAFTLSTGHRERFFEVKAAGASSSLFASIFKNIRIYIFTSAYGLKEQYFVKQSAKLDVAVRILQCACLTRQHAQFRVCPGGVSVACVRLCVTPKCQYVVTIGSTCSAASTIHHG
jgi:hypothetical protein